MLQESKVVELKISPIAGFLSVKNVNTSKQFNQISLITVMNFIRQEIIFSILNRTIVDYMYLQNNCFLCFTRDG